MLPGVLEAVEAGGLPTGIVGFPGQGKLGGRAGGAALESASCEHELSSGTQCPAWYMVTGHTDPALTMSLLCQL